MSRLGIHLENGVFKRIRPVFWRHRPGPLGAKLPCLLVWPPFFIQRCLDLLDIVAMAYVSSYPITRLAWGSWICVHVPSIVFRAFGGSHFRPLRTPSNRHDCVELRYCHVFHDGHRDSDGHTNTGLINCFHTGAGGFLFF